MSLASFRASTLARIVVMVFIVIIVLRSIVISAYAVPSDSMQPALLRGDYVLVYTLGQHLQQCSRWFASILQTTTINELSYGMERGAPIAFRFSYDSCLIERNTILVKRIVGLPGDTLTVTTNGIVFGMQALQVPADTESNREHTTSRTIPFVRAVVVPRRGQQLDLNPSMLKQWKEIIENEGNSVEVLNGIVYINANAAPVYVLKNNYYYVLGDNSNDSYDSRYWGFVKDSDLIGQPWLVYWSRSPESSSQPSTIRWNRIATFVR